MLHGHHATDKGVMVAKRWTKDNNSNKNDTSRKMLIDLLLGNGNGGSTMSPEKCNRCGKSGHNGGQCNLRSSDVACTRCGLPGHSASCCKTSDAKIKKTVKPACVCCGSDAHEKKDCPSKDTTCDTCGKKGHVDDMCWKKSKKTGQAAAQAPAPSPAKNVWAAATTATDQTCTYFCQTCNQGVLDPDKTAVKCPWAKCKSVECKPSTCAEPPPQTSLIPLMKKPARDWFSKQTSTPSKEQQAAEEKITKLEEEMTTLKGIEGTEGVIKEKVELIKDLQAKLPQKGQSHLDQAGMYSSLAELENKVSLKEGQLKAQLETQLEKQKANVTELAQRTKEMREETENKVKQLEENQKLIDKTLSAAIQKTHSDLEDLAKEAQELAATLPLKVGGDTPGGTAANVAAASGITMVPVMPGNIIHSNSVNPAEVWSQLSNDATLTGFSEEQAAVVTRKVLEILLMQSMQVGPPQPQPQQQPNQLQLQQVQFHANQDAAFAGAALLQQHAAVSNDDEELTDIELSEGEAEAALVNAQEKGEATPPKVKRITKAAKKRILLKKAPKGGK